MDRTDISASLVGSSHAPVEPDDFVANGINVVLGVEIGELMWKEMTNAEENQTSDSEKMIVFRVMHHRSNLSVFVTIHVDSPID